MRNRFKLNEEEKSNIKRLHNINEQSIMGNIFNTDDGGHTIGKNTIIKILKQIKELQEEDSPAIAQRRLEELFEKVGLTSAVDIVDVEVEPQPEAEEENQKPLPEPINEENVRINQATMERYMEKKFKELTGTIEYNGCRKGGAYGKGDE